MAPILSINMNPDAVSAAECKSYEDVFDEIGKLSAKERIVFVIDEYPYLAKSKQAVSSMLQHLIDHVRSEGRLFLICGPSMSFMEYQVLVHHCINSRVISTCYPCHARLRS